MGRVKRTLQTVRNYGVGFILFRIWYALERKTGLQRRKFKMKKWQSVALSDLIKSDLKQFKQQSGRFFFDHGSLPSMSPSPELMEKAANVLENKFTYFFSTPYYLGDPPDWFLTPLTGKRANNQNHWTQVQDLDPEFGDIKYVWEASRFAWSYVLVRAWAATGDERYVEKFWQLFLDWHENNPPNRGPHYYCGQECAIRLMALSFAWFAFHEHPVSTPERQTALIKTIGVLADRIEKNIAYAVSTRTNHALSESAGIYTAGLLFPQFRKAALWRRKGKRILQREAIKQIADDGSYIQHSMNYHRFMLQCLLWSLRLGNLNHERFSETLLKKLDAANRFVFQIQGAQTGRVPNYGPNDGALIMPLNDCDYLDYRPVIQAVHYMLHQEKLYPDGPWDVDLHWFFGNVQGAKTMPVERTSQAFESGGYYTLRAPKTWGMIRCHSFKTRPSQSDSLHLDVWYNGVNILRDSGSFLYNNNGPLKHFFKSTAAHNTIRIDGLDQMTRGPRFIWYDWLQTGNKSLQISDDLVLFGGEHYGYERLENGLVHRRTVALHTQWNVWVITDEIKGQGNHEIELFWQLPPARVEIIESLCRVKHKDVSFQMLFQCPETLRVHVENGAEEKLLGYESLYYGEKQQTPVIYINGKSHLPLRLTTVVVPDDDFEIQKNDNGILIVKDKQSMSVPMTK